MTVIFRHLDTTTCPSMTTKPSDDGTPPPRRPPYAPAHTSIFTPAAQKPPSSHLTASHYFRDLRRVFCLLPVVLRISIRVSVVNIVSNPGLLSSVPVTLRGTPLIPSVPSALSLRPSTILTRLPITDAVLFSPRLICIVLLLRYADLRQSPRAICHSTVFRQLIAVKPCSLDYFRRLIGITGSPHWPLC